MTLTAHSVAAQEILGLLRLCDGLYAGTGRDLAAHFEVPLNVIGTALRELIDAGEIEEFLPIRLKGVR